MLCSLALALALAPQDAPPADPARQWGQWRGPLATGVAPHADPPVEWSEEQGVRWRAPLFGLGHSTPAVWSGRVFLTTAMPVGDPVDARIEPVPGEHDNAPVTHEQELFVLAYDLASGAPLWRTAVGRALPHEGGHVTNSHASASPIAEGELVWAFFGSYGLHCLDARGVPRWSKDLGRVRTKHAHGEGSSPALHGDVLVVNVDHEEQSFVVTLDKHSGEERWRAARDEGTSWASPIVVEHGGRALAVVSGTKRVRAYDLADGSVVWECGGLAHNVVASPVAGGGMVFAASSYEKQAMIAVRLDGAKGDLTESEEHLAWVRRRSTPYVPSPLLSAGRLWLLHHYQGVLSLVDAQTGADLGRPMRLGLGDVYASPVAAAGRVYVVDRDGATVVLSDEAQPRVLARNRLDDRFSASPVPIGDALVLRGERTLYCVARAAQEQE